MRIDYLCFKDGTRQWKKPAEIYHIQPADGWVEIAADYIIEGKVMVIDIDTGVDNKPVTMISSDMTSG